jgi:hypothetical protein
MLKSPFSPPPSPTLRHYNAATHTPRQKRQSNLTRKCKPLHNVPPPLTIPRKIAPGVFIANPNGADGKDKDTLPLLSTNVLIDLGITHTVVVGGSDFGPSCAGLKALFVGPRDPLSKVIAWMCAVRQLGAHIIVGDASVAAGYLVIELGLAPRIAWLRVARGIPPAGDHLLARLYALVDVQTRKGEENGPVHLSECTSGSELARHRVRDRTRAESGLKNVFVSV